MSGACADIFEEGGWISVQFLRNSISTIRKVTFLQEKHVRRFSHVPVLHRFTFFFVATRPTRLLMWSRGLLRLQLPRALASASAFATMRKFGFCADNEDDSGTGPGQVYVAARENTPNITNWWQFGCNPICKGRVQGVKPSSADNTSDVDAIFQCPGCAFFFHGDCMNMDHAEKTRMNMCPSGEFVAACPSCLENARGLWGTAAISGAELMTGLLAATKLGARPTTEDIEALATKYNADGDTLLQFKKLWDQTQNGEAGTVVAAHLRTLTAKGFVDRMPEYKCFNQTLVGDLAEIRRKMTAPSPGRRNASLSGLPPPTVTRGVGEVLSGMTMAVGKRPIGPAVAATEGATEGAETAPTGKEPVGPCSVPKGTTFGCNVCGQYDQWATKGGFEKHLHKSSVCGKNYLPDWNTPMSSTVQYNLRRLQSQDMLKPQGRPSKKARPEGSLFNGQVCDYCDSSRGGELLKCISYTQIPINPVEQVQLEGGGSKKVNWFRQEAGCTKYVHLECVRKDGTVNEKFDGTVSLAQAGRALIGFCKECFIKMEEDRPLPEDEIEAGGAAGEALAG